MGKDTMETNDVLLNSACKIVAAYIKKNHISPADLPMMIRNVHGTLGSLGGASSMDIQTQQKPAISIRKSITTDYIVCLEDGKKLKMLKRYLRTRYGLSPEAYRAKWGLPADYPLVAPSYAARRSEFAKKIGLGRRPVAASKRRKRG
jgi:predicted transcriptional regulator